MLDRCADGYQRREQGHFWRVEYRNRVFPALPLGKRKSKTPVVEIGVLKKMVRHLELDLDCVFKNLPQLGRLRPQS